MNSGALTMQPNYRGQLVRAAPERIVKLARISPASLARPTCRTQSESLFFQPESLYLRSERLIVRSETLFVGSESLYLRPETLLVRSESLDVHSDALFVEPGPLFLLNSAGVLIARG